MIDMGLPLPGTLGHEVAGVLGDGREVAALVQFDGRCTFRVVGDEPSTKSAVGAVGTEPFVVRRTQMEQVEGAARREVRLVERQSMPIYDDSRRG